MRMNKTSNQLTYREFLSFMNRYNKGNKRKQEATSKSPYKYVKVFNKDKKNES